MACLAGLPLLAPMNVVIGVTRAAIGRELLPVEWATVAASTCDICVGAGEIEVGPAIVIEANVSPPSGIVTSRAVVSVAASVLIVGPVTPYAA
jgi:hypothetical protein